MSIYCVVVQKELVLSTTLKNLAPFNLCRTLSTNFELWHGLMINLFKCVRSKHNQILPIGFLTQVNEFSHSMGSEISTLCSISSLTSLSNSAFKGSCMAWGTLQTSSTWGIAPSFSLILISPFMRPLPLNNSLYSNSICCLKDSPVISCTLTTLTRFSTMSKFILTSFNFSESIISSMAVSCSTMKNLQIEEFLLKLSLILQVPYCFIGYYCMHIRSCLSQLSYSRFPNWVLGIIA